MLFDVCGDMTDSEVIDASPELTELGDLIGKLSVADFKKKTEAERSATRDERASIPARIDEANRAIPAEDSNDWEALLAEGNKGVASLQDERSKLQAGGKAAELRARIIDLNSQSEAIRSEIRNAPNAEREKAIASRREIDEKISEVEIALTNLERKHRDNTNRRDFLDQTIFRKRAEANEEKAKVYAGASDCPTCKRALPEDQVQAALDAFNENKAARLDVMIQAGKKLVGERNELALSIEKLEAQLSEQTAICTNLKQERDAIAIPEQVTADPSNDPRIIELAKQREALESELNAIATDMATELDSINRAIASALEIVDKAQRGIASQRQRADGLKRVDELKLREKSLSAQWEQLERSLYLCEQFVRFKVSLLSERINKRFYRTTFRLFKEQINGGLQECCDVLWRENEALPSNGQSVQIGLDIISTLSDHRGFAPTIFVDNAESVTDLPNTQGQQIRLVVSKGDRDLRIVMDNQKQVKSEPEKALF